MTPRDAIYDMLEPIAGVPLIWGYRNGPRPAETYIQMHTSNNESPDHDHYGDVDALGYMPVDGFREATLELVAFGPDGESRLNELVQRLRAPTQCDRAELLGLAFFDAGPVNNMPVKRDDAQWEPRSLVELGVRWTQGIIDDVGLIELVEYDATLDGRTTQHAIGGGVNG